jgi:hypothetical protein
MSATSIKAALLIASAALVSMAVVPALAQQETQAPPQEIQELPTKSGPHSTPVVTEKTPRELQLRDRAMMPPRKCHSTAGTKADAEKDCASVLQCQAPTPTVDCKYRQNNQDWICSCK